jgi:hypothetical protein
MPHTPGWSGIQQAPEDTSSIAPSLTKTWADKPVINPEWATGMSRPGQ